MLAGKSIKDRFSRGKFLHTGDLIVKSAATEDGDAEEELHVVDLHLVVDADDAGVSAVLEADPDRVPQVEGALLVAAEVRRLVPDPVVDPRLKACRPMLQPSLHVAAPHIFVVDVHLQKAYKRARTW